MGGVSVSEVMKSDAGHIGRLCKDTDELMSQAIRLQRAPVLSSDNIGLIGHPDAYPQKLFCLTDAVSPQLLDDQGRESNRSSPTVLRLLQSSALCCLFRAFCHRKLPARKIDGTPSQGGDFSTPETA